MVFMQMHEVYRKPFFLSFPDAIAMFGNPAGRAECVDFGNLVNFCSGYLTHKPKFIRTSG